MKDLAQRIAIQTKAEHEAAFGDEHDQSCPWCGLPCSNCGSTETVEIHHEDDRGREQSITICAGCGQD